MSYKDSKQNLYFFFFCIFLYFVRFFELRTDRYDLVIIREGIQP